MIARKLYVLKWKSEYVRILGSFWKAKMKLS